MALGHCISYAIYFRVLFIIKIVLSYTIDILIKNTFPNPTIGFFFKLMLFMEYSKPKCSNKIVPIKKDCTSKLKEHLFSSAPIYLAHELNKSLTKSYLQLWKQ